MTARPDLTPDAAPLRAALITYLEHIMTVTDTEHELGRFRAGLGHRTRRRRSVTVLAAAACVAVLATATVSFLVLRDTSASTLPAGAGGSGGGLSGSMLLEVRNVEQVQSEVTGQNEARDVSLRGPVTLRTAEGEQSGTVDFTNDGAAVGSFSKTVVLHAWGKGTVTLGDVECRGTYAFSFYREPSEGGGSLNLACDDGSVLGAALIAERIEPHPLTDLYQFALRLEDGFFVEG